MVINVSVNFDNVAVKCDIRITAQELRDAVNSDDSNASTDDGSVEFTIEHELDTEREQEEKQVVIKENDINFSRQHDARVSKKISKKPKKCDNNNTKKIHAQNQQKAARINKVRKYTKEMQNREAVKDSYSKMKKMATSTVSTFDDKFVHGAKHCNYKFDDAIYNSPTADDASDIAFDIADDIIDDVESYE